MAPFFRLAVRRSRGSVLGWGLAMVLLGATAAPLYAPFLEQQKALREMLHEMPAGLVDLFGGAEYLFTPEGYLTGHVYAVLPLLLGVYVVVAASGLLAADEETGRLDLLLAQPVSRVSLYASRVAAWLLALGAILVLTWLGLVVPMAVWPIGVTAIEALLPLVSISGTLVLFGALALLLSQVLASRRLAAGTAGVLLLGSYALTSAARLDPSLAGIARLSPLTWYQGGAAMRGLYVGPLLVLHGLAAALFAAGAWRFERRDVRLGG